MIYTIAGGFVGIFLLFIIYQFLTKMKIVGGNELGVVTGKGGPKGFNMLSGGRTFVIPLFNRFTKMDLTPHTIEVKVESAIAAGIVPLNVKATVSFAISSSEAGRRRAATRIVDIARDKNQLRSVAADIIEGHLRDSIASITPEQVMMDKDTLVAKLINACKADLENIGLEITTMNIADVDDNRLPGVDEPDLYIALLKRVQTASALTKARVAKAEGLAAAVEEQELNRADVTVRSLENEYANLVADTKVTLQREHQRRIVGVEKATRDAAAKVEGLKRQVMAEQEGLEMLRRKYDAEVITPAQAESEKMILDARGEAAMIKARADAEIAQLKETLEIIKSAGEEGRVSYILENLDRVMGPFAETLGYFPVDKLSIITGADKSGEPISAVHPNALAEGRNNLVAGALTEALSKGKPKSKD
jgi:flotillin